MMNRRKCILLLTLIVAQFGNLFSQDNHRGIELFIDSLHAANKFNGNVLIAKGEQLVFKKSYGIKDFQKQEVLNEKHVFQLASVSKQFTAMGIMILKERGLLEFDDPVKKYLTEYPYPKVKIKHLMSHSSGMPTFAGNIENYLDHSVPNGNKEMYEALIKYDFKENAAPGEEYEYSDIGFDLMAMIIEKLSGESYAAFMKKEIFDKVGMPHTYSAPTDIRRSPQHALLAEGYVWQEEGQKFIAGPAAYDYVYRLGNFEGDGSIYSCLEDMHKYSLALDNEVLVSSVTLEEAFTPFKLNNGDLMQTPWNSHYGYGWDINHSEFFGKVVQHSGGQAGFRSYFGKYLDQGYTIILLCNFEYPEYWEQVGLIANRFFSTKNDK